MSRSLSSLANFLLKSHYELREMLSSLPNTFNQDPITLGMHMGASNGSVSIGTNNGLMTLTFTENGLVYRLTMPIRVNANEPLKVKVALSDGASAKSQEFEGSSLFSAEMPEQFKALHKRVTDYLKTVLPESLLARLQTAFPAKKDAEKKGSAEATGASTAPETTNAPTSSDANTSAAGSAAVEGGSQEVKEALSTDSTPADEFQLYHVSRDDQPDLRFRGKRIAYASTPLRQGRQHVYEMFVTPSGKYIGIKAGLSYWVGERDKTQVQVAEKADELVGFFGHSPLAKALYAQVNLVPVEFID